MEAENPNSILLLYKELKLDEKFKNQIPKGVTLENMTPIDWLGFIENIENNDKQQVEGQGAGSQSKQPSEVQQQESNNSEKQISYVQESNVQKPLSKELKEFKRLVIREALIFTIQESAEVLGFDNKSETDCKSEDEKNKSKLAKKIRDEITKAFNDGEITDKEIDNIATFLKDWSLRGLRDHDQELDTASFCCGAITYASIIGIAVIAISMSNPFTALMVCLPLVATGLTAAIGFITTASNYEQDYFKTVTEILENKDFNVKDNKTLMDKIKENRMSILDDLQSAVKNASLFGKNTKISDVPSVEPKSKLGKHIKAIRAPNNKNNFMKNK